MTLMRRISTDKNPRKSVASAKIRVPLISLLEKTPYQSGQNLKSHSGFWHYI